jgi:hypothetical protein
MVVFEEPGFPVADAAAPDFAQLHAILPSAMFVPSQQLKSSLSSASMLILPYGSAFPEAAWPEINAYLTRGGNLLVIGGRPFTRAAFRTNSGWQLREYSVRFIHELQIDQYQETPGSDGLQFEPNPDIPLQLAAFRWARGFSPVIRLSSVDLYKRGGSAGALDARLDVLAWGTKDRRRMTAPAIVIDHVRSRFFGGRWIFVNSEIYSQFYEATGPESPIAGLASLAARGSHEFTARPTLPLYAPGEPIEVELNWLSASTTQPNLRAEVSIVPERGQKKRVIKSAAISDNVMVSFPPAATDGLHLIEARLFDGDRQIAMYRSAFWMCNLEYLRSGPKLTVNEDYFELDGRPLPVVGTTYMASDVQRLFFDHPNVYVWDKDLGLIVDAGLNMVRTSWWTNWDKMCDETGRPYERTLRTLEAYLMTARRHGLPVQFNFFAFLPDVLGGNNAYLDPESIRRQKALFAGVAGRFRDVPFVAWDLINEPSFSQFLWRTRPNGDYIETAHWNEWLKQRYPDRATLAEAWGSSFIGDAEWLSLPTEFEFNSRAMYSGVNSLKLHDFYTFAQEKFAGWAQQMRDAIRAAGAQQLVTVGQDEGGYDERLSPAFFGPAVDFTTTHSWWENDALLWDSLVAKQPGKAMLVQETGLQRELTMDEVARRTVESEGALFERKMAMAFVQGSGAIQWLWNTNTYMTEANEAPIGALRGDATEKPEATVLREFAKFAAKARDSFKAPEAPSVAIVTSQAAQFSVLGNMQVEAQRKAVRALTYYNRVPAYVVAENRIRDLGTPKLVILPSPQALSEPTWQALLDYVKSGGNLLITGPVNRDAHWKITDRLNVLGLKGTVEPLTYKTASIKSGDLSVRMTFDQAKQNWLEAVRFRDGNGLAKTTYGTGKVFCAGYPLELAEGLDASAQTYAHVLREVGIKPMFELQAELSPGVLVYPTALQNAVMYIFVSDDAQDARIKLRDSSTGAQVDFNLPSQRAAIKIVGKTGGKVIADYFPSAAN